METTNETPVIDLDAVRADAMKAERKRAENIRSAATALGLPDEAATHIASGADINATRAALIAKRAELDAATATNNTVRVGASHADQVRDGIENAIMHRVGLVGDLTEAGRSHRHMTLIDMARASLRQAGVSGVERMSASDVSKIALKPQNGALSRDWQGNVRAIGGHTGADFPYLLARAAEEKRTLI